MGVLSNRTPPLAGRGVFMKEYLAWKKSYLSPVSYPNYERWTIRFFSFIGRDISKLALDDLQRFKDFLIIKGYSPKNIEYGLSIIRDFLSYQNDVHPLNFPLKRFKIRRERSIPHYAITEDEYRAIRYAMRDENPIGIQRQLMIGILWDTGVRVGELMRLKVKDLRHREAVIENEKNQKRRLIMWSEETQKLLERYLVLRHSPAEWLFTPFGSSQDSHMSSRNLEKILEEIRVRAGIINKITPHSFRHGFVHRQLAQNVPITTVAQMLGHSTSLNILTYHQLSGTEVKEAWRTAA